MVVCVEPTILTPARVELRLGDCDRSTIVDGGGIGNFTSRRPPLPEIVLRLETTGQRELWYRTTPPRATEEEQEFWNDFCASYEPTGHREDWYRPDVRFVLPPYPDSDITSRFANVFWFVTPRPGNATYRESLAHIEAKFPTVFHFLRHANEVAPDLNHARNGWFHRQPSTALEWFDAIWRGNHSGEQSLIIPFQDALVGAHWLLVPKPAQHPSRSGRIIEVSHPSEKKRADMVAWHEKYVRELEDLPEKAFKYFIRECQRTWFRLSFRRDLERLDILCDEYCDSQNRAWKKKYWTPKKPHLNGGRKFQGWENVGHHPSTCKCDKRVRFQHKAFEDSLGRLRGKEGARLHDHDDAMYFEIAKAQTDQWTAEDHNPNPIVPFNAPDTETDSWWSNELETSEPGAPLSPCPYPMFELRRPTPGEIALWEKKLREDATANKQRYQPPELKGLRADDGKVPIEKFDRRALVSFDGNEFVENPDAAATRHVTFEGRVSQPKRHVSQKFKQKFKDDLKNELESGEWGDASDIRRKIPLVLDNNYVPGSVGRIFNDEGFVNAVVAEIILENESTAEAARKWKMKANTLSHRVNRTKTRVKKPVKRNVTMDALTVFRRITVNQMREIDEYGGVFAFSISPNSRVEILDLRSGYLSFSTPWDEIRLGWSEQDAAICDHVCDITRRWAKDAKKWVRVICVNFGEPRFYARFEAMSREDRVKFMLTGRAPQPFSAAAIAALPPGTSFTRYSKH